MAVAVRDDDQHRRDRKRDQGEPPVEPEHDRRHGHDGQHVLEEEDEPVAEEEPDTLQVDGRSRHQLPGLVAVVVAEREPEQVGVERVPQIELDAERLPPRDQAAADHERRLHDAEAEDHPQQEPQLGAIVRSDRVVDDATGDGVERELGRLGAHREEDGDDQRDLVRLQEAEQARERAPVRRSGPLLHPGTLAPAVPTNGALRAPRGSARSPVRAGRDSPPRSARCCGRTGAGAALRRPRPPRSVHRRTPPGSTVRAST
jgi:hypothetical protein